MTPRKIVVALLCLSPLVMGGCRTILTGGGELGMGMRNDNFFVFRHTVDGDKVGKSAESELQVDPAVYTLLGGPQNEGTEGTGGSDEGAPNGG